jgi:translocator protein
MNTTDWYNQLIKPSWSPLVEVFGQVWSVLYVIIIITFTRVFWLYYKKQLKLTVIIPFILNILFNILFTPIQFGLQNNILASIDIVLILITLVWAMVAIYKHSKWLSILQIPYLLWVCIATMLQLSITYLNW